VTNTSNGVVLNGSIDYSSATISMFYDGVNPPFIQTNGTLTLSGGTVVNVNNTGAVLGVGNHTIIAAAQLGTPGAVGGSLPSVNLTGNGAVGAASLAIDGSGDLQLVVAAADEWTGASDNSWANAGNWSPANVPNPLEWILFDTLSTHNLNTVLNQDFVPTGLSIVNPSGPVTIGGGNNLEIGAGGINMQSASQDLTITAPLTVANSANWNVAGGHNLNINGGVTSSSASGPTIVGAGTVNINSSMANQGTMTVSSGSTLKMTTPNVLSSVSASTLAINGVLDLNGKSQAIDSLSGIGIVDNTGVGAATLTNGYSADNTTFNGIIQNTGGALALQVAGGTLILTSTNSTYSGGTTFNQGALLGISPSYTLGTGPVTFNPGSGTYTYGCTFTNVLSLNSCLLHLGGNLDNQIWSGPVSVTNGFDMAGDNGGCQIFLSGPMNIGTGGISVTNHGNEGPQEGYNVGNYGDALTGSISGSGGITYYCNGGNSRLTVQGANTYSGGTIVNGTGNGKLNVWAGINPFSTGPVTLNAGAIIEAAPGSGTVTNALTLNGGILQSEPQYNNYNTLTWSGPITMTANSALVQNGGGNSGVGNDDQSSGVNVSGSINIGGYTLAVYGNHSFYGGNTISGPVSGSGLIIVSNNVLQLNGANTYYTGTFRAAGGTIGVGNANAMQSATLDMNAADSGAVNFGQNSSIGGLIGTRNLANAGYTLSIGYNTNNTTTYSGILSGNGGLIKIGTNTQVLSGANSYAGNTTVSAGTLSIAQPTLALLSTVTVAGGAVLNLTFTGTNAVQALVLNGVSKPNGVYNTANSGGLITGTGAIQVGAYPYIWSGALSSEWSTNILGSPKNWTYFSNPINYSDGSAVQFDDTSANPTVSISLANVAPAIVTFSNSINSYTIGGSYGIAGSTALIKYGSGLATLNTVNSYTGPTIINAGSLTIGGSGSLGSGSYSGNITNNGTLNFNNSVAQTLSGIISGTGAINDSDTGGMALNGANTFSGGFNLLPGAANIGSGTTVGGIGVQFGTGPVTISSATYGTFYGIYGVATQTYTNSLTANGTLLRVGGGGSHTITWSGPITLSTNGLVMGGDGSAGAITLAGNITVSSPTSLISSMAGESFGGNVTGGISGTGSILTVSNLGAGLSLNGPISGSISVYSGAGTVVFGTTNTFSGTARSLAGTLQLNNALSLQNATLDMNSADSGAVTYSGITTATFGALTGSRNLALPSGAASIGNNNTTTAYTGLLTGNSLIKIGSGTLTLSSNAYTGNTTVSAGTLSIAQTNLAFSSIVTVAGVAVLNLNYTGTNVVSELVLNGVIQPNGVYKSTTPGGYITGSGAIQVGGIIPNVWTGAASGTWSTANIGSPFNWKSNSIAGNYTDGSAVLFDDTLLGNNVVLLTNNVSPIAVTFNNNNTNYTIGGSSAIAGNCALIKNGAGTVTLTNNNTYTGSTVINSNTLTIGNAGKLGNGTYAGSILINTGATLEYNSISAQNLSGPITGAGRLIKDGATKVDLTLSSALNTYSGPTIITNGRVFVSVQGNIGGGTTIVQTNAGQLYISAATTISNPMNLSSAGYPEGDANNNFDGAVRCDASSTLSGTITLSGNARIANYAASGVTFTISGQITGPYSIDFYGMNNGANSRNFLLSNTGNNFTGNANIFCNDYASARTGASSTLKLGASDVIPNGNGFGNVVFNGADANHLTILEMNGFNETINGVSNVSSTGAIIQNTSTGTSTLTIGDGNTNSTFTGVIKDGGVGSGKYLALTKIGTGKVTLTGANSYNGNTTVSNGTLAIVQPTLAVGSTVTLAAGAALELDYAGANLVTALVLNGVNKPAGTYNSGNSGGLITGTGSIVVGSQLAWTGGLSSEWSVNVLSSPKNWANNGVASDYANSNPVLFDDTLTNNSLVNISVANVTPAIVTFNNSRTNYTLQGSSAIAGSGAITKNGTASVTILNANSYTGGTIINAGTVEADANSALGTGTVTMNGGLLTNNVTATLANTVNLNAAASVAVASAQTLTLSGAVTNSGALTKLGAGTLTLSGPNTYAGNTTVSAGALNVTGSYTGATNGSVFLANGSSLTFNMGAGTANFYGDGYASSPQIGEGSTGTLTLQSGTLNVNSQTSANSSGNLGSVRLGNAASGNGTVVVNGGALNVPGRILVAANSAAAIGNVTISSGTVTVGTPGTVGNYAGTGGNGQGIIWFGGGISTVNLYGGTLALWSLYDPTAGSAVTVNLSGGTLKAIAANSTFVNVTAGTLTLKVSTNGVTINPASYAITIPNALTHDAGVTGADGGLTVNDSVGGGTLTLSAANTYTGTTTISGGTLLANNTTGSGTGIGAVSINTNGTLGGTGIISGAITNYSGGILLPGASGSGTLTVSNYLTLQSGSTNTFAVNGTTPANTKIVLAAPATVKYGGVLNIVTNGTFTVGQTFTLFSGAGATNTGNFASIAGSPGAGKAFTFTNGILSVVIAGPTLTSVTPNPVTGSSYGVTLTLTGSGFTGAGVGSVLLTNVTAATGASYTPVVINDTSLTVSFVPGTATNNWNATVVNGSPSAQVGFTVAVPAKVIVNMGNLNAAGAGKLVLSGTGGALGNQYEVLSATNLLTSSTNWVPVYTNTFGVGGIFNYTNTVDPGTPGLFLRLAQ